jgi:ParB-like chromosome segregation protein Spo0J
MTKQIEYLSPSILTDYERNSRTHSREQVEQIAASIREFGFTNPVLIDDNNRVIAGHGRLQAATMMNMDSVPCLRLTGLTDDQLRAYVIADNKLAENAGWDKAMLNLEIEDLKLAGFDLDLLGFTDGQIKKILNFIDQTTGNTDPDDVPETPQEPKTRPGDIYLLGSHRLMCGDSTLTSDVNTLMGGGAC